MTRSKPPPSRYLTAASPPTSRELVQAIDALADEIDRHAPPGNRALHHAAEAARLVASKWRAAVAQSPAAARQVEADDLALARRNAGLDEERRR